jgi:hypothetical protein
MRQWVFLAMVLLVGSCGSDGAFSNAQRSWVAMGQARGGVDWLVDPTPFRARCIRHEDGSHVELNNGLVRRVFSIQPGCATVALDNLMTGEAMLRSVRPEAIIELNGVRVPVGGLGGQPVHNFIRPEWAALLRPDALPARILPSHRTGAPTQARREL